MSPFNNDASAGSPLLLHSSHWVIAGILLIGFSGCGGESTEAPPPPPPSPKTVAAPKPAGGAPVAAPNIKPKAKQPIKTTATVEEDIDTEDQFVVNPMGNYQAIDLAQGQKAFNPDDMIAYGVTPGTKTNQFYVSEYPPNAIRNSPKNVSLPAGFTPLPEEGYDISGWPLRIRCEADGSVMAYIPEGVFIQGHNGGPNNSSPEHAAYVSAFYIDIHETTNAQFEKFRQYLSDVDQRSPQPAISAGESPDWPVSGILWRDALAYCEANGKQLPTEAEWEKAARGAGGFNHPWGFSRPTWIKNRSFGQVTVGGEYPTDQSPYGVFDMAGNVGEFVADWYRENSYQEAMGPDGQTPRNWEGPSTSEPKFVRTIKGNDPNWNLWFRDGIAMTDRIPGIGFRGVLRVGSGN